MAGPSAGPAAWTRARPGQTFAGRAGAGHFGAHFHSGDGNTTGWKSISSTPRATWILPRKWSAPLAALDMAVLVISAVEGIQAQTEILYEALRRCGVAVFFFINKIDRAGSRVSGILEELRGLGAPAPVQRDFRGRQPGLSGHPPANGRSRTLPKRPWTLSAPLTRRLPRPGWKRGPFPLRPWKRPL